MKHGAVRGSGRGVPRWFTPWLVAVLAATACESEAPGPLEGPLSGSEQTDVDGMAGDEDPGVTAPDEQTGVTTPSAGAGGTSAAGGSGGDSSEPSAGSGGTSADPEQGGTGGTGGSEDVGTGGTGGTDTGGTGGTDTGGTGGTDAGGSSGAAGSAGTGGTGGTGSGANSVPVVPIARYAIAANTSTSVAAARGLLDLAVDVDGDPLRVASVGSAARALPEDGSSITFDTGIGGELTLSADGSFLYAPPGGGSPRHDTVAFSVSDGHGGLASTQVVFSISPGTFADEPGFEIAGNPDEFLTGRAVSRVGDFNDDGFSDVLVAARGEGSRDVGYLVFGSSDPGNVTLDSDSGVKIIGETAELDELGVAVSPAGHVNSDRFEDFIIGVHEEPIGPNAGDKLGGKAYVVFGSANPPAEINLATLEADQRGFVIIGAAGEDHLGFSVASAGNFNGSGGDDLVLGAIGAFPTDDVPPTDGKAYVVFGKNSFTPVNLADLGSAGFRLNGESGTSGEAGVAVAGVGDWNSDGRPDIAVSATKFNSAAGRIYVVYGKTGSADVDLSDVAEGDGGLAIDGHGENQQAGRTLQNGGNIAGSALPDLIIGVPNPAGVATQGTTYVVYGTPSTNHIALLDLEGDDNGQGFAIRAEAVGDRSGLGVAGVGDFNSDGRNDLAIGAGVSGAEEGGAAYLLFGSDALENGVDLLGLSSDVGLTLRGEAPGGLGAHFGFAISSAGDMNGDGRPDLIIGAPQQNDFVGRAYVLLGRP